MLRERRLLSTQQRRACSWRSGVGLALLPSHSSSCSSIGARASQDDGGRDRLQKRSCCIFTQPQKKMRQHEQQQQRRRWWVLGDQRSDSSIPQDAVVSALKAEPPPPHLRSSRLVSQNYQEALRHRYALPRVRFGAQMQEARVEVHSADKVAYVERIWCVLSDVKRGTKAAQSRVSRGASDFF